ncbi:MAG: TonB-dependent receptor [Bacteroidetes bacterium]|nr:TonB-dependent receptor [Bacteroidota bacterium]
MIMKKLLVLIFICTVFGIKAQDKFTVSGYAKDAKNGEALIGVTVYKKNSQIGTSTNEYGFYSLTLPKGQDTIVFSFVGYKTVLKPINLTSNLTVSTEIGEEGKELEEVVISSEREDKNIKSMEMSVAKLDIKQIQKMPALLGEVDIVKSIQLLPGVTTVGEGASGFNVRGGNIDQNLVLMDEAPVYNSSHLFGFFSIFNPDAVKDVKLIKGGIPAQYGGRASSVLDIRMKEGNSKKMEVNGGLGTIFSRLSIEAPIFKDKASFIVAGRRSYIDVLAKPLLAKRQPDLKDAKFYFYDLTAKLNWRINDKNTVFASGYLGRDIFGAGFVFNWGNTTGTVRWNHIFNSKLFMNLTAFYSNYKYELGFKNEGNAQKFEWKSNIINYSFKPDFTYYLNNKNTIKFGAQAILYTFKPGEAIITSENGDKSNISLDNQYGVEYAAYVDNEQKLSNRFTLQYGLRWSFFNYMGKGTKYTYRDTIPNESKPLEKEEKIGDGKNIATYNNPEPRLAVNYTINDKSSVKLGYNRMSQYLHIVSNTAASTPLDIYTPVTNNVKPLISDQITLGYFRNFKDNMFETSAEIYYKDMQNQLDYVDNANLLLNPRLESDLVQGKGRAYGFELYLKKAKGKFTGWVSYTLSKTERQVRGISNEEWFLSKYDRTHNVNTVLIFDLNKRFSFSANFVYQTGTPATFPTAKVEVQGYVIPYNTDNKRNNYRNTPYHRADIGITCNLSPNNKKGRKHALVLSVYNVYNRRNAFSIYFRNNPDYPVNTEAVRYSVIASIVPAITYNFKF